MRITLLCNNNKDVLFCVLSQVFMRYYNIIYVFFFASLKGESINICCNIFFTLYSYLILVGNLMLKIAIHNLIRCLIYSGVSFVLQFFNYKNWHKEFFLQNSHPQVLRLKKENKCKRRVHHTHTRLGITHILYFLPFQN